MQSTSTLYNLWRRFGLLRSMLIYYAKPFQLRRMTQFYRPLIRPGDLCFDIGAHVGNRINVWSRLGARIVALEPQPSCIQMLENLYGSASNVTLVETAVGATPGTQTLHISPGNPTVSTLSTHWIDAVSREHSFNGLTWPEQTRVQVTTLDALIERFGVPAFVKIDVEGYEAEVLGGLSQPLRMVSFEFTPPARQIALNSLKRLQALGDYRYNWFIGEQHRWQSPTWLPAQELRDYLTHMRSNGPSGDIFARRADTLPNHSVPAERQSAVRSPSPAA